MSALMVVFRSSNVRACIVGKADVVGINELHARCGWQIINVQVEESRCRNRSLWQAILLHPP